MALTSNHSQNQFDSQVSIDVSAIDEAAVEVIVDEFLANAREQVLQELKTIRDKNYPTASANLTFKCESDTSREIGEVFAE